jgi:hypothetical protein
MDKSFLVLFFKKELLSSYHCSRLMVPARPNALTSTWIARKSGPAVTRRATVRLGPDAAPVISL